MSHSFVEVTADRRDTVRLPEERVDVEPQVPQALPEAKSRQKRGTSEYVQVKLDRKTYEALKVVASLTGKTLTDMLKTFVDGGIKDFSSLTVSQLIHGR